MSKEDSWSATSRGGGCWSSACGSALPIACEHCGETSPGIPFKDCRFCGEKPCYHHGRCCPKRPSVTRQVMIVDPRGGQPPEINGHVLEPSGPGDPGWKTINAILGDEMLPKWDHQRLVFIPQWTMENSALANRIINNTYREIQLSKEMHEVERKRRWQDRDQDWTPTNLGYLDRSCIWERPCKAGAVIS